MRSHVAGPTGETVHRGTCDRSVDRDEAIRCETDDPLDPRKWQTPCCPECGRRLKTVFVGVEDG